MSSPILSIVVPLAPGERPDTGLLADLEVTPPGSELIVSLTDDVAAEVLPASAQIVHGSAGRGRQLNRGAAQARGQWLWFVHADCRLEPGAVECVLDFAEKHDQAIGYARLRFLDDGPGLARLNAHGANLRSRLLGLPYGDQGLCVPAERFGQLGGFREDLERGEDLDFVVRARRSGLKTRPMELTIRTSARRYRKYGWLTTTLRHQVAAWHLIRNARRNAGSNRT